MFLLCSIVLRVRSKGDDDDDQFNRKCHTNAESDNFALIHYGCRSLAKHFSMIMDHITTLDSMFDGTALYHPLRNLSK